MLMTAPLTVNFASILNKFCAKSTSLLSDWLMAFRAAIWEICAELLRKQRGHNWKAFTDNFPFQDLAIRVACRRIGPVGAY